MSYENVTFEKMVQLLAKPGDQILQVLTEEDAHSLHMLLGIVGEVGELILARSLVHVCEELGDLEFYLEGSRQGYSISRNEVIAVRLTFSDWYEDDYSALAIAQADIVDAVKRFVIYRKPLDKGNLITAMARMEFAMDSIRQKWGLSREDCLRANREKLLTGEKARYALGQYSDQQANDRADKA